MKGYRWIRPSAYAVTIAAAVMVGIISYQHALWVVRSAGETGAAAFMYPATIDGLVYVASMVMLDAAHRGIRAHWLARALLVAGILATAAANLAAGAPGGLRGLIVYGWPAPVVVGIYELVMVLIRQGAKTAPTDPKLAGRERMAASITAGNPYSARKLAKVTPGLSRDDAGAIVKELTPARPDPFADLPPIDGDNPRVLAAVLNGTRRRHG
jgi:hypothetical protein